MSPTASYRSTQRYVDDTNVLVTDFVGSTGRARLIDSFSVARGRGARLLAPDHEILRVLEGVEGEMGLSFVFAPRRELGTRPIPLERFKPFGIRCSQKGGLLLLRTSLPAQALELEGARARGRFRLRAGERVIFSLTYNAEAPGVVPPLGEAALERLRETEAYWRQWASRARYQGPYERLVRRSALALKLLCFAPSGAVIAAPTTSLPETRGGSRNWDYRYCWLRDAAFTTRALTRLGYLDESAAYLGWLLHSTRLTWPRLQTLYSVYGGPSAPERVVPELSGYAGSRPVRVGNAASHQHQLDVYGEVIDAFSELLPHLGRVDGETRKMLTGFARTLAERWPEPDHGIWEIRGEPAQYTHSKVMAWAGLERFASISLRCGWRASFDAREEAKRIREAIEREGFNPTLPSYVQSFGGRALDASLLTLPLTRYCSPSDARFEATRSAVVSALAAPGLLIRRYAPGSDGLEGTEGAFALCNFWLAEGLALAGRPVEALRWFRAVVDRLNPLGLAPEELDPREPPPAGTFPSERAAGSGAYLGNYPQGFSHVGLINSACEISRALASARVSGRRSA